MDKRKISWKLSDRFQKIGEWNSQKATCNFAGRKWIAWFSTEIPIPDGPYKFSGLPGLIVKIEDVTRSHIFELSSILKLKNLELNLKLNGRKSISVTEENYIKVFKEYRKDPMKRWIRMGIVKSSTDLSPDTELLKKISDSKKRLISEDNNILELDLLRQ